MQHTFARSLFAAACPCRPLPAPARRRPRDGTLIWSPFDVGRSVAPGPRARRPRSARGSLHAAHRLQASRRRPPPRSPRCTRRITRPLRRIAAASFAASARPRRAAHARRREFPCDSATAWLASSARRGVARVHRPAVGLAHRSGGARSPAATGRRTCSGDRLVARPFSSHNVRLHRARWRITICHALEVPKRAPSGLP